MRLKGLLTGAFALLILTSGCKLFGPEEEKSEVDPEASKAKTEEAGRALEDALGRIKPQAPPQEALKELDLTYARDLYREAVELDPSNSRAHFGMAVTELLMLLQNERVQEVMDSLSYYLEKFPVGSPVDAAVRSPIAFYRMAKRAWPPGSAKLAVFKVSDVQKVVEEEVLPAIGRVLKHLEEVEKDPEFKIYVPTESLKPAVKGMAEGMKEGEFPPLPPPEVPDVDSVEVDLGEVYVLDAQVRLFRALLLILTAYNLDFDYEGSYEFFNVESDSLKLAYLYYLDRNSSFLTLRSEDNPSKAKDDILTALGKFEDAVAFIRSEDDPQEDDLIAKKDLEALDEEISPDEETPEFLRDVETIEDLISKVRKLVTEPIPVREDFDHDGEDEELLVNLSVWFDHPPKDLKALLPYHKWNPENFGNDNFFDDLVLTDAQLNPLGMGDPPFVLPDPSFGGIFPQFTSNEEFLSFFGLPLTSGPLPVDPLNRSGEGPPLLSSAGRTK
ncbi:MAG: hypothetical protein DRP95_01430 [Candidatus Latescibacterota bacterium]|nr:MAG: hypothetical protein DRP95_01430 [Candidatus Latescibacterota bacterium]